MKKGNKDLPNSLFMLPSTVEFNLINFTQLTLHSYSLSPGAFWNFKLLVKFYIFTSSSKVLLKLQNFGVLKTKYLVGGNMIVRALNKFPG